VVEPVRVTCPECGVELAGDSPDLRLELTCDDEPIVYWQECREWPSAHGGDERQENLRPAPPGL
jgi:hypothetical protein